MDLLKRELEYIYSGKSISIEILVKGSSKTTYKVDIANHQSEIEHYIVQITSREAINQIEREYKVLEMIYGKLPSPQPVKFIQYPYILEKPIMITSQLDGQLEFNPISMDRYCIEMVDNLLRIHNLSITNNQFLPSLVNKLTQTLSNNPKQFDEDLEERKVRFILMKGRNSINHNSGVMLHGDFWPGNILWKDNKISGILDWEDVILGDPLYDIAICKLELTIAFGYEIGMKFINLYRTKNKLIDYKDLSWWELFVSLRCMNNLKDWSKGWSKFGRSEMTFNLMKSRVKEFIDSAINEYYGLYNTD